ncbi:MAG: hypothetical protein WDZ77_00080 [Candidatus Pacearchaeota archaeon]
MTFTPVEIIALVMIIGAAIKILMLLINPKTWMNFTKDFYSNPGLVSFGSLILAAVVLYYLLMELTIVQIVATTSFVALLVIVGMARYIPDIMKKFEDQIKKGNLWKENLLYTVIWVLLLVWAAKEIFMV